MLILRGALSFLVEVKDASDDQYERWWDTIRGSNVA